MVPHAEAMCISIPQPVNELNGVCLVTTRNVTFVMRISFLSARFNDVCFFDGIRMCECFFGIHVSTTSYSLAIPFLLAKLRITARWVLLGLLAVARGVQWGSEQPGSSLMPLMPYIRFAALSVNPIGWFSVKLS